MTKTILSPWCLAINACISPCRIVARSLPLSLGSVCVNTQGIQVLKRGYCIRIHIERSYIVYVFRLEG